MSEYRWVKFKCGCLLILNAMSLGEKLQHQAYSDANVPGAIRVKLKASCTCMFDACSAPPSAVGVLGSGEALRSVETLLEMHAGKNDSKFWPPPGLRRLQLQELLRNIYDGKFESAVLALLANAEGFNRVKAEQEAAEHSAAESLASLASGFQSSRETTPTPTIQVTPTQDHAGDQTPRQSFISQHQQPLRIPIPPSDTLNDFTLYPNGPGWNPNTWTNTYGLSLPKKQSKPSSQPRTVERSQQSVPSINQLDLPPSQPSALGRHPQSIPRSVPAISQPPQPRNLKNLSSSSIRDPSLGQPPAATTRFRDRESDIKEARTRNDRRRSRSPE